MSNIEFNCPSCGAEVAAPEHLGGSATKCPHCDEEIVVPGNAAPSRRPARRVQRIPPESIPTENPSMAWFAAGAAALVGALIWAAIVYFTHYEVGYVAWGIGALVGAGCSWASGRGRNMAIAAAALSLVAILGGKLLATKLLVDQELEQFFTTAAYEESNGDAEAFVALGANPTADAVRTYLVERGYVEMATEVTDADAEGFANDQGVAMREWVANPPSFDEWRDENMAMFTSEFSLMSAVTEDLNLIDLLFAFLGISTAYGIVMAASNRDAMALHQAAARAEAAAQESGEA